MAHNNPVNDLVPVNNFVVEDEDRNRGVLGGLPTTSPRGRVATRNRRYTSRDSRSIQANGSGKESNRQICLSPPADNFNQLRALLRRLLRVPVSTT